MVYLIIWNVNNCSLWAWIIKYIWWTNMHIWQRDAMVLLCLYSVSVCLLQFALSYFFIFYTLQLSHSLVGFTGLSDWLIFWKVQSYSDWLKLRLNIPLQEKMSSTNFRAPTICWNKALWLAAASHVTSLNQWTRFQHR